jgi:hypothetical protein
VPTPEEVQAVVDEAVAGLGARIHAMFGTTPPPPDPLAENLGLMIFVKEETFDRDLAELVATGATWGRFDIPIGAYGSISNGVFTRNAAKAIFYKQAMAQVRAAGIKVVLVMASLYVNNTWSEAQFNDYNGQYVKAVAEDIGEFVDLWQIYNEHDGRDYRNHASLNNVLSPTYLQRMNTSLTVMRDRIRSVAGLEAAKITTTPFGYPVNDARVAKWKAFFDGLPVLDVICVHAYPEKSATAMSIMTVAMRELRARYGKPVGILEFGLPSVTSYGTFDVVGDAVVAQIHAVMLADPFVATLYQLRDRGVSSTNGELAFGILTNGFSPKAGIYDKVVAKIKTYR